MKIKEVKELKLYEKWMDEANILFEQLGDNAGEIDMTEKQKRFQELADRSNEKGYAIYSDFLGLAEISDFFAVVNSMFSHFFGNAFL